MNATTAELQNLANGSAAAGDQLAEKICLDAITELDRLQGVVFDLEANLTGLRGAVKLTITGLEQAAQAAGGE